MTTNQAPQKHSVLLVDDEPEILFSLKGLLRREFNLFTAESGAEALEVLRNHPIHVVMSDQRMPEMTGVELMSRIKVDQPDAIRMIFTGYADIKAVVEAINTGGLFRYITKPWDPDELLDVLREATQEYDAIVEGRRLLRDTSDHLKDGLCIVQDALNDASNLDHSRLSRFIENSNELLARIDRA
ncbi:MAG: response regulator [Planctomycetales bacterium]|nr:response regulator [Planctomycetales bacterium]